MRGDGGQGGGLPGVGARAWAASTGVAIKRTVPCHLADRRKSLLGNTARAGQRHTLACHPGSGRAHGWTGIGLVSRRCCPRLASVPPCRLACDERARRLPRPRSRTHGLDPCAGRGAGGHLEGGRQGPADDAELSLVCRVAAHAPRVDGPARRPLRSVLGGRRLLARRVDSPRRAAAPSGRSS